MFKSGEDRSGAGTFKQRKRWVRPEWQRGQTGPSRLCPHADENKPMRKHDIKMTNIVIQVSSMSPEALTFCKFSS